ncbi:MAG TPA: serine hydrolase, partial [Paracoccaceae bacterium]|nr:serine hydrolase [Paracoccaceae bacterium]
FDPLGMNDTRFEVEPHMASRLAKVTARREDGQIRDFELSPPSRPEFYGMGHALYSTAPDYMRFVRMHLNRGALEGKRIISAANHEQLLANQIGGLKIERMVSVAPVVSADVDIFPHHRKSHSFTFMRMEEDVASMRSAGSQFWAGVLNTHFWFDPAKDMAGIIMTQMLPFADPRFMKVYEAFEHAAYAA